MYYVKNGRRKMLKGTALRIDHKAWHVLRVKMKGDRIEVYLDDKKYLDVRDSTFANAGSIGLWTKAGARTPFDDLIVRALEK